MFNQARRTLTPLMRAAAIGHVELVSELLSEGADVNERGPRDSTALMFAAGGGHAEIVKLLVEHGADAEAVEAGGWTASMHAEVDGHRDIVGLLASICSHPQPGYDGHRRSVR